jgi:predicted amidohydrolase
MRVAAAQPAADAGPEEGRVEEAVRMVAEAGTRGAGLVLMPEAYPGPMHVSASFDCSARIASAAASAACAVCWGRLERGADGRHRIVTYIHGDAGEELMRYERAHPATGDVGPTLSGVAIAPGEGFGLAEVAGVGVGVLVCSELWLPEVARVLAISGAEVILAPAGGGFHRVATNWQLLARARAIENECFVALTQRLLGRERGSAMIAGPEGTLTRMERPGLCVADLDLERARWLRERDDSMREPKPFASLPGLLRARRPGLYGVLTEPTPGLYDYDDPPAAAREPPS